MPLLRGMCQVTYSAVLLWLSILHSMQCLIKQAGTAVAGGFDDAPWKLVHMPCQQLGTCRLGQPKRHARYGRWTCTACERVLVEGCLRLVANKNIKSRTNRVLDSGTAPRAGAGHAHRLVWRQHKHTKHGGDELQPHKHARTPRQGASSTSSRRDEVTNEYMRVV